VWGILFENTILFDKNQAYVPTMSLSMLWDSLTLNVGLNVETS